MLASLYGGRIAEEIIYGDKKVTTGASNDIQRASEIARNMIKKWGLSDKLGPIMYGQSEEHPFLGHSMSKGQEQEFSGETANKIDIEVRKLIDKSYATATKILKDNMDILHAMTDALMKYETLDADQIKEIMDKKPVTPPDGWNDKDDKPGSKDGKVQKKPRPKPKQKPSGDIGSVTS